ncbi:MAG: transcriptional coactivator p15/PC4 family protein [bacterium]|nr:transcriptional coactivator p15/PC4 family protein [bacterium]
MDDVIAQFEKNATEVVRVSLTEFRGHKLIDLRVYYSDDEGQFKPTKKGYLFRLVCILNSRSQSTLWKKHYLI